MGQEKRRARSARPLGSRVGKRHEYQDQNADHGAPNGHLDEEIYKMLNTCIDYENFRFFPSITAMRTKFLMDMMFAEGRFSTQDKKEIFSFTLQKLTNDLFLKFRG